MAGPDARAPAFAAFAVDKMLGRLARWLRILGHDVAYGPHLTGRTLDPELPAHLFITSDHFRDQLRQVAAAVPLGAGFLHRCLDCNRPLDAVAPEAVAASVPPYVLATQDHFERCSRCGRVYWPATHRAHMLDELAALGLALAAEPPL
jgi:uncharacterized protein